jgi:hypothetical protein
MNARLLPFLAALATGAHACAQTTSFSYQGQLKSGGQPASGPHDFQFRLFDASAGGAQVGPTQCVNNVAVSGGLFTATIDFGQQYAAPGPRFLEVQVRADTGLDCSSAAGFVALAPRQPVTPAPSASHASSAFALDGLGGSHPGAVSVDSAGRVGVGTAAPQGPVHLLTAAEGVRIQGPSVGTTNTAYASFVDSAGTRIGYVGDASSGDRSIYLACDTGDVHLYAGLTPTLTAKANGNVGIGTTTPGAKLDVRGDVRLSLSGFYRAAAGEENLRIVRGVISLDGAVLNGSGFTVSHPVTGKYQITFTPAFAGLPAITATVKETNGASEALPMLEFAASSGVLLEVYARSDGSFVNRDVQFIAVGPR